MFNSGRSAIFASLLAAFSAITLSLCSHADTIHFKNGTVIGDVKVLAEDWRGVKVEMSPGVEVSFPREDIQRVERRRSREIAGDRVSTTWSPLLARIAAGEDPGGRRAPLRGLEVKTATGRHGKPAIESGPQLTARVRADKRGDTILFILEMHGGGATYAPGRIVVNGKRPPPPGFEIRDEEGSVIYRDKFKYG